MHKLTITYESDDTERVAILHKLLGALGSRRELRPGESLDVSLEECALGINYPITFRFVVASPS